MSCSTRQELAHNLHEPLPLLKLSHVARVFQRDPSHFRDQIKEGCDGDILNFVVSAVDQQCAYIDLVQLVDSAPVSKVARDEELGGT